MKHRSYLKVLLSAGRPLHIIKPSYRKCGNNIEKFSRASRTQLVKPLYIELRETQVQIKLGFEPCTLTLLPKTFTK